MLRSIDEDQSLVRSYVCYGRTNVHLRVDRCTPQIKLSVNKSIGNL